MEYWTKGLETAIKYFGENSRDAFSISKQIATFLYDHGQYSRALQYTKTNMKIVLENFSKELD